MPVEKICRICGEDCSDRARTKDAKGNYYCRICHDAALAANADQPEAPLSDDGPGALDLLGDLAPAATTAVKSCPECGANLPGSAVLCTGCGLNLQTGCRVEPQVVAGPPPPPQPGGGQAWPTVIGGISLVLTGLMLAFYGLQAFSHFTAGDAYNMGRGVSSTISVIICLLGVFGAINVLRRIQTGVRQLRIWSIIMLVLTVGCGGLATLMIAVAGSGTTARETGVDANQMAVVLLVTIAIIAAWPTFLLIWFGRDSVQRDINRW